VSNEEVSGMIVPRLIEYASLTLYLVTELADVGGEFITVLACINRSGVVQLTESEFTLNEL
jgi:hypothetical protein